MRCFPSPLFARLVAGGAPRVSRCSELRRCASSGWAGDSLTLEQLAARFANVAASAKDVHVRTRLRDLPLARARLGPSRIAGAGLGLFAARDLAAGELVTLFPGDAVMAFGAAAALEDDAALRAAGFSTRAEWERLRDYRVRTSATRGIGGDPARVGDTAYLGHMANDGVACHDAGAGVARYERASRAAQNVGIDSAAARGCHHALVALRPIAAGDECLSSYGCDFWLSRRDVPPTSLSWPDGASYYGDVRDGRIRGDGEYCDARGNRCAARRSRCRRHLPREPPLLCL